MTSDEARGLKQFLVVFAIIAIICGFVVFFLGL